VARVALAHTNKLYDTTQVIFDVSLVAAEGELVVFVGPSGCGKSTLLRMIAGLEGVSSGTITIGDEEVTHKAPADRGVAMVFQSYALYPHMSVRENMEFGLKVNGVDAAERDQRVREAAAILQLEDYLARKPGQLSGGQRQRVAIGRAIVKQPKVFLFDEPLSNLDAALRIKMRVELESLHNELASTMIYVTHDQVEAMTLADRIVVLNEGRVEQIGTPMELYHSPRTRFVAGFIGSPSMNFVEVETQASGDQDVRVVYGAHEVDIAGIDRSALPAGPITLGIRPEHIQVGDAGGPKLQAQVRVVEALGNESYVYVRTEQGDDMVIKADGDIDVRRGQAVGLSYAPHRCQLFQSDGLTLPRLDRATGTSEPVRD
jgi:ABC-type sugar transport system ATPase subunit